MSHIGRMAVQLEPFSRSSDFLLSLMPTPPTSQERPKAFHRVYVYFAKAIVIAGKLAPPMVDTLMAIAPATQAGINAVLVRIHTVQRRATTPAQLRAFRYNARCGSLWSSWAFSSMVICLGRWKRSVPTATRFIEPTGKHSIYPPLEGLT